MDVSSVSDWRYLQCFLLLLVLAERSLLLRVLDNLFLHAEAFAAADSVHVFQGLVGGVSFFPEVQVFFLGGGNPVWITADHLGHREEDGDRDVMVSDGIRQNSTSVHVILVLLIDCTQV